MKPSIISLLAAGAALTGAVPHAASSPSQSPLLLDSSRPAGMPSKSSGSIDKQLENIINDSPLLSFHRDIVQIESITGNEHDVGVFISQFLTERNFTVIKQTVTPADDDDDDEEGKQKERFNIYAYPRDVSEPEILLTSHIDTVPPFIPYSLEQGDEDDDDEEAMRRSVKISGRGTVDAKASVAAQIFAALETLHDRPSTALGLLFVVGEETGGDGMRHFSRSKLNAAPPTFHTVIFGEPTESALVSGHKGMLGFEVVATGRAAHSGYPWLGRSAVSAILPALSRVDRLGDIPVERGGLPSSPKYGRTTVNVGFVRGGVAANVVPAAAEANVAVRLAAGTPEEARRIVEQAVHDAVAGTDGQGIVEVSFKNHQEAYGPQDLDTDVDGFDVITVNYGTDVPNLVIHDTEEKRVKRYLYGPGSILVAHGDHEALTVGQLEDAVTGYRKLIDAAIARNEQ